MPIDKDEWDKGRTSETIESRIESFLKNNPKKAYKQSEIVSALYNLNFDTMLNWLGGFAATYTVGEALKNLVKSGAVKSRIIKEHIGEDIYYSIG